MADKSQEESNQFVPVDHLSLSQFKMSGGEHNVEARFFFVFFFWHHKGLEEMMLHRQRVLQRQAKWKQMFS